MFCNAVFSYFSLKPSKLIKHFQAKHDGNKKAENDLNSLKAKKERYDIQEMFPKLVFGSVDKGLLFVSYKVVYEVEKIKKPHTFAQTLFKPCVLEMVKLSWVRKPQKNCSYYSQ